MVSQSKKKKMFAFAKVYALKENYFDPFAKVYTYVMQKFLEFFTTRKFLLLIYRSIFHFTRVNILRHKYRNGCS